REGKASLDGEAAPLHRERAPRQAGGRQVVRLVTPVIRSAYRRVQPLVEALAKRERREGALAVAHVLVIALPEQHGIGREPRRGQPEAELAVRAGADAQRHVVEARIVVVARAA